MSSSGHPAYPFASNFYMESKNSPSHLQPNQQKSSFAQPCSPRFKGPVMTERSVWPLSPLAPRIDNKQLATTGSTLKDSTPSVCGCQRPQSLVMCASCGHSFTGRVRSRCPVHPTQIFLMDHEVCPHCNSTCIKEYSSKLNK